MDRSFSLVESLERGNRVLAVFLMALAALSMATAVSCSNGSSQADYDEALKEARGRASALRDDARAEGRKVVDGARAQAEQEVDVVLQAAAERLKLERDAVELDLRGNVPAMSATLASRILGVDVATAAATGTAGR